MEFRFQYFLVATAISILWKPSRYEEGGRVAGAPPDRPKSFDICRFPRQIREPADIESVPRAPLDRPKTACCPRDRRKSNDFRRSDKLRWTGCGSAGFGCRISADLSNFCGSAGSGCLPLPLLCQRNMFLNRLTQKYHRSSFLSQGHATTKPHLGVMKLRPEPRPCCCAASAGVDPKYSGSESP